VSDIVVATINARYHHASLGLRYIFANLDVLRERAQMLEFTLENRAQEIAEQILAFKPRIVGLGVYIWNVRETSELAAILKRVAPEIHLVLGGPEVGFANDLPLAAKHADYLIAGQGDHAFRELCLKLLDSDGCPDRFIQAEVPELTTLASPYRYYTDADIKNRLIYVEASRGCPFKCEFCLSSLDRTAWNFDLDHFLVEMEDLYRRGVRHFKFVDRTFNLKLSSSIRILEFFLAKPLDDLFLHFELIPDRLPEGLKDYLQRFPGGTLQFEIGVQSLNAEVQRLISRRQDDEKTRRNLHWIRQYTRAHIHADLIFGLPGEDLASFCRGFNQLYQLEPHEIQLGILKRLRGTPLVRHESTYDLRFNSSPPYNILSTSLVDFNTMQRVQRFARYWDMIANSGRFGHTMTLLPAASMFETFMALSEWLYNRTGKTHRIALNRLFELLYEGLLELGFDERQVADQLQQDFIAGGFKGRPGFIDSARHRSDDSVARGHNRRQNRHQALGNTG